MYDWSGFLSIVTGIIGVMLAIKGGALEPKSQFLFILGLVLFGIAFLLRVMHLFNSGPRYSIN